MAIVIPITDVSDERIADYRGIPDPVLLRERGLFVAEGRLVVRQLLSGSRIQPRSVLVTEPALRSLEGAFGEAVSWPIYVAPQAVMNAIVGFNIHRGCLALGVRPVPESVARLIGTTLESAASRGDSPFERAAPSRVVVLEAVSNVDNVGGIFRAVSALGGHAVVVGPGCGDPLYRKAIRTSIGATLRVPFAVASAWPAALDDLRASGFTLCALTPRPAVPPLEDVAADLRARARVALLVGAEGAGLSEAALDRADLRARIPMAPGMDSINVTMAVAIGLYRVA